MDSKIEVKRIYYINNSMKYVENVQCNFKMIFKNYNIIVSVLLLEYNSQWSRFWAEVELYILENLSERN